MGEYGRTRGGRSYRLSESRGLCLHLCYQRTRVSQADLWLHDKGCGAGARTLPICSLQVIVQHFWGHDELIIAGICLWRLHLHRAGENSVAGGCPTARSHFPGRSPRALQPPPQLTVRLRLGESVVAGVGESKKSSPLSMKRLNVVRGNWHGSRSFV